MAVVARLRLAGGDHRGGIGRVERSGVEGVACGLVVVVATARLRDVPAQCENLEVGLGNPSAGAAGG